MNFRNYKSKFKAEATKNGCTDQFILNCLDYAQNLQRQKLPIIYNSEHLSCLLGYNEQYLKKAVTHNAKYYRNFTIAKKSGKPRSISEPLPNLKEIQTWILQNLLSKASVSKFAKAYIKDKGLRHNIRFHTNQKMILTTDIQDFFPSLKFAEVEKVFWNLGYTKRLSNLLAKLCCKSGSLPQGAPTSPYLSNLIMKDIDNKIGDFCTIRKIRYTRYADDMSFSGDFNSNELKSYLKSQLTSKNLQLNHQKSKLMLRSNSQIVTGIVVNEKAQVSRKIRQKLRQELHYIEKFGVDGHLSYNGVEDQNYLKHLYGKVGFVTYINPNDKEFLNYKRILKKHILKEKVLLEE